MNNNEMIATYNQIKKIIDNTDALLQEKYKECVENNWMSDYTDYSNELKTKAFEEIQSMTKD